MAPDLAARQVLMSSFLYYRCSSPILSDGEYDRLTEEVADRWKELSPDRQWQLGSAKALRATGHHCKITAATFGGALAWHLSWHGRYPDIPTGLRWRRDKKRGVQWIPAEG